MKKRLYKMLALCLLAVMTPCTLAEVPDDPDAFISEAAEPEVGPARDGSDDTGLAVEPERTGDDPDVPYVELDREGEGDREVLAAALGDEADEPLPAPEEPEIDWPEVGQARQDSGDETFEIYADVAREDLFAGYVDRLFHGDGGIPMATENAGAQLTGTKRILYDALKPEMLKVAAGERASTQFAVPMTAILGQDHFSAQDLGVQPEYNSDGTLSANSISSMWAAYQNLLSSEDIGLVATALWYDCTYELYWLDRYKRGSTVSRTGATLIYNWDRMQYEISLSRDAAYTLRFPVLEMYASNIYEVNPSLIHSAQQAAATARDIVNKYADYTDYAKLFGYAVEIAKLVDYNKDATYGSWDLTEQNPWKLIWVFDGDSGTNVVCEGYAQAFQYLCELTRFDGGIRCFFVDGFADGTTDKDRHAWNVVRMDDGRYYLVDVTWMDNNSDRELEQCAGGEGLAACISQGKGSLFLVGAGSGSVSGGYSVRYRGDSKYTRRVYSDYCRSLYSNATLTLAGSPYMLTGFQKMGGKTYYYDADSRLVTGTVSLEGGMSYRFGSDGALISGWAEGWHNINGKRYYFDSNGLHAEHTVVTDRAVAPTCTNVGYTEGSHCGVCGTVLVAQKELPALGHDWAEADYAWASGNASVTATRICRRDGSHTQTQRVDTLSWVSVEPTCEGRGETTWRAVFTAFDFQTQQKSLADLSPLGHDWGEPAYTWSPDNASVTATRVCKRDGGHVETETVNTTGWVSLAATCEAWGETTWRAEFANAAFLPQQRTSANLPPLGHDWGEPTYAWSQDNASVTATRACRRNGGHVETETADAYSWVSRAAACEAWGETTWSAIFMNPGFAGQTVTAANLPPTGHTPTVIRAVAATDTKPGLTEGSRCAACDKVLAAQRTVPKLAKDVHMTKNKTVNAVVGKKLQIVVDGKAVKKYKSGNTKLAQVSSKGIVLPKAAGTVKITVTLKNGKNLTLTLKVTDPNAPKKVGITMKSSKVRVKKTLALTAVLTPANAKTSLTWTSSRPDVATVSSKGVVKGKKPGTAKITVTTANNKKYTVKITVTK